MHNQFVEDLKENPVDPSVVLTDEQLKEGGLVSVNAFMRTKASKNALRVRKSKEKAEAGGVKQINVQAPVETHAVIKQIADRAKSGEPVQSVINSLAVPVTVVQQPQEQEQERLIEIGKKIDALQGYRRVIARLLGIL